MKIKGVFLAAIFAAVLCISSTVLAATYDGGSGTVASPYEIRTPEQMNSIGANPGDWASCFKLTADIDMSAYTGTQYNIIGNATTKFTGTFDGNNHKIRNLTYTTTTAADYVGLFGRTSSATIKNVGVENVNLNTSGEYAGGLVGYQDSSTITNCTSTGSVTSTAAFYFACAGGLVGQMVSGSITSCTSTGSAIACSPVADFTMYSNAYAGGLAGISYGTITNCFSTGAVYSSSFSFGSAGASSYSGGLVGYQQSGTITSCYSTGSAAAMSSVINGSGFSFVGGLVGSNGGSITSCYATGSVSATGGGYKGGLLGYRFADATINASFWDKQTSGLTVGVGSGSSTGITGKTTVEMRTRSTFTAAGWDFTDETANGTADIWRLCTDGKTCPRLGWQSIDCNLACSADNNFCDGADMNKTGTVDMADFALFADNWMAGM